MVAFAPRPTTPLLTIAIPTYNRSRYLAENLAQLRSEVSSVVPGSVEILVSDNCSPDGTPSVVYDAIASGLSIRYVRNETNVGWALNFVQCFDLATGKYVLLLGDDDLLVDGALALLMRQLTGSEYGLVCLRPYGFDLDFRREHPGGTGRIRRFSDANRFLLAISRWFTLTSACVINKSLVSAVDSREFVATNLAVFHLVLRASLAGRENLFVDKFLVASKRQNSGGYDYAQVFVGEMWRIIDGQRAHGLSPRTIRALERQKLLSYYPFYLLDLRLSGSGNQKTTWDLFAARFHSRLIFRFWLAPIIWLPRPIAIAWGGVATVLGRIIGGDLQRGLKFMWNRLMRSVGFWRVSTAR